MMFKEESQDVQEDTTEVKYVAGPVLTRAQANKSDKIHQLKVKEAMSSVDKTTRRSPEDSEGML